VNRYPDGNPSTSLPGSYRANAGSIACLSTCRCSPFLDAESNQGNAGAGRKSPQRCRKPPNGPSHKAHARFFGVLSGQGQVKALEAAEASSQSALDANKLGYQVACASTSTCSIHKASCSRQARPGQGRYDVLVAA